MCSKEVYPGPVTVLLQWALAVVQGIVGFRKTGLVWLLYVGGCFVAMGVVIGARVYVRHVEIYIHMYTRKLQNMYAR